MNSRKLFFWLAAAAGYIGIGMLLGYAVGDQTINTALWLGILLVVGGAILLGMGISGGVRDTPSKTEPNPTSNDNLNNVQPK